MKIKKKEGIWEWEKRKSAKSNSCKYDDDQYFLYSGLG